MEHWKLFMRLSNVICRTTLFVIVALFSTLSVYAEDKNGTTITVREGIRLPVTVDAGSYTFTVNSRHVTYSKIIDIKGLKDGYGNRLTCKKTIKSGLYHHVYYDICTVHHESNKNSGNNKKSSNKSSGTSGSSYTESNMFSGLSDVISSGMFVDVDGYPCVAVGLGMSKFTGEFAKVKWSIGGMTGFVVQGSVGKEFIFNSYNKKKIAWNAGFGVRMGTGNFDGSLNVLFGETPLCLNYGMLIDLEAEYYFGRKKLFGVFGSVGYVMGNFKRKKPEFFFDFSVGVAIKLWQR